ncbi:MAG: hypothetical protein WBO23_18640, partial [Burkholderiales bacterium]
LAALAGAGYWLGTQRPPASVGSAQAVPPVPLAAQAGTTAVAIHFDGWRDWRDAYRALLAVPQARYVNRVAVSAGRPDWTHFRWPGNERWWSPDQAREGGDMLEEAVAALQARGYRVSAIFDVFAARYLKSHPEAAATDVDGRRSADVVCLRELARGDYGRFLLAATEALAASTRADTVAITELFYDKYCFDDASLADYRRATGNAGWPRTRSGRIDWESRALDTWRSRELALVVERLSRAVRRHGKTFALDVKFSRGDLTRNSAEYGQDYALLAPWVDEFVVWDYFAIEGLPPENAARVAAYFDDEFGANAFFLSIGLWDRDGGTIPAEAFARGLRAARLGGAERIWITPARDLSPAHWDAVAEFARGSGAPRQLSRR